jgi:hypothetical protein
MSSNPQGTAASDYEAALDRVGAYLRDCADDDLTEHVVSCPQHPVTVGDLWTLYCAHREGTHRA